MAHDRNWQPMRLFPADDERAVVHILEPGTRVGRKGDQLKVVRKDQPVEELPLHQVGQVVLHSFSQLSTQALHCCHDRGVGIHFVSGGGRFMGSVDFRRGSIQRRIQQYRALTDEAFCLKLAQQLVTCRGQSQRKFLLRSKRNAQVVPEKLDQAIAQMKAVLKQIPLVETRESLLGIEGNLAALYFQAFRYLIDPRVADELKFETRNRRSPKDRVNALLGFGYALLLKDVMNAILAVGLEPALGFYHQPRTQAPPLALDLMEIFRVPLVDMVVVSSINRKQWQPHEDFEIRGQQVWLSDAGRRRFIQLYERRKSELWKHPVLSYSLSYRRLLELEVRLLEKEWYGEGGTFAKMVVR